MSILSTLLRTIQTLSYYPTWQKKIAIKRWYKTLALDKHLAHYQQLFKDIDGFSLSREARKKQDALEYTYGEIDFISFIALLSLTKPGINTVFYDLGSGTGKAVLACMMVFNVQKSCGIELFQLLHNTALKQQQRLQQHIDYPLKSNTLQFINADFLQADFSDATLIFINATAFFGETWGTLNQHLMQVRRDTIIVTTSKKLFSEAFIVTHATTVQMSWGLVKAYIQRRR